MEGKNRGILGRFHTFVCEITREKTSMDHKEKMSVFGIRPLMEAVDSGKIPDKIFIQRGLRGEAAAAFVGLQPRAAGKTRPLDPGKPPGGFCFSLAGGVRLGRGGG